MNSPKAKLNTQAQAFSPSDYGIQSSKTFSAVAPVLHSSAGNSHVVNSPVVKKEEEKEKVLQQEFMSAAALLTAIDSPKSQTQTNREKFPGQPLKKMKDKRPTKRKRDPNFDFDEEFVDDEASSGDEGFTEREVLKDEIDKKAESSASGVKVAVNKTKEVDNLIKLVPGYGQKRAFNKKVSKALSKNADWFLRWFKVQ